MGWGPLLWGHCFGATAWGPLLGDHCLPAAQVDIECIPQRVRWVRRDDESVVPALCTFDCQRGGGGGFPDAALAADEDEAVAVGVEEL